MQKLTSFLTFLGMVAECDSAFLCGSQFTLKADSAQITCKGPYYSDCSEWLCCDEVFPNWNVALGKPASASAVHPKTLFACDPPRCQPKGVTDGKFSETKNKSFWILPDGETGWVQVDLGRQYLVSKLRWLNTRGGTSLDRGTMDYHIELSVDGKAFTTVTSGTIAFLKKPAFEEYLLPNYWSARYVRFHVDSFYQRGGGLNELEVYETPTSAPTRTPTAAPTGPPTLPLCTVSPAPPVGINVARDQTATASASTTWGHPAFITDGAYYGWELPAGQTGWVQVDLGREYSVGQIRFQNNPQWNFATKNYHIALSTDGVNFMTVTSGSMYVNWGNAYSAVFCEYTLPSYRESRYVRFYVDSYFTDLGGLGELEVYETPIVAQSQPSFAPSASPTVPPPLTCQTANAPTATPTAERRLVSNAETPTIAPEALPIPSPSRGQGFANVTILSIEIELYVSGDPNAYVADIDGMKKEGLVSAMTSALDVSQDIIKVTQDTIKVTLSLGQVLSLGGRDRRMVVASYDITLVDCFIDDVCASVVGSTLRSNSFRHHIGDKLLAAHDRDRSSIRGVAYFDGLWMKSNIIPIDEAPNAQVAHEFVVVV